MNKIHILNRIGSVPYFFIRLVGKAQEKRLMTMQQLQYLICTAQLGSISQAAESMFVSQSSISKSIRLLEKELGFSILNRSYSGVSFTVQGLNFLRDAYRLVGEFETVRTSYTRAEQGISKTVSFAISSQHYLFVLHAISRVSELFRDLRYSLTLREGKTTDIIQDVFSRRSDLGFLYYYELNKAMIQRELERRNLKFHPLCQATPHAYLGKKHPLAQLESVSLDQLQESPFVHYDFGTDHSDFAEEVLTPAHPIRSITVSDRYSLFRMIAASGGYGLGSGELYEDWTPADIRSVPVRRTQNPHGSTMTIGWIYLSGQEISPDAETFLRLCKESIRRHPGTLKIIPEREGRKR